MRRKILVVKLSERIDIQALAGGDKPQCCCLKPMLLIFLFCFGSTYLLVVY